MRIFLDANVLFAAAQSPTGRSALLISFAKEGKCECITSPHAITEAQRNLEARYPHAIERFHEVQSTVRTVQEATTNTVHWALQQGLPENDAPILAAAVQAKADVLVTGDKTHFGHLFGKTKRSVKILSLKATLELLLH
jgi:putative PIN family toxin of toxin-antitoxin system